MASIKKTKAKKWMATVRGLDGREHAKTFARKVDAERWATNQEADKARGQWIDPRAGRVTFGQWAEEWANSQMWRAQTATGVEQRLRIHVLPYLGEVPLASLKLHHLQSWARDGSEVLAPSTLQVTVQTVRSVLKAAVDSQLIATNPAAKLRLPRPEREKVIPLEPEQVAAIGRALPERYRAMVTVATGTGLRLGELTGLTIDRIDWLRREIRVDRQLTTTTGGAVLAPVKTSSSDGPSRPPRASWRPSAATCRPTRPARMVWCSLRRPGTRSAGNRLALCGAPPRTTSALRAGPAGTT